MEIADQMKGDFIGSISHEFRSLLYEILASAEFLSGEVMTGFEKELLETINSCSRTLLDTIVSLSGPCLSNILHPGTLPADEPENHFLVFSEINHFKKDGCKKRRNNARRTRAGSDALTLC